MEIERLVFRLFEGAGEEIYLVGGGVRDRLLQRETLDLDFATGAMPAVTMDLLRGAGMRPIPTGIAYGTVSAAAREEGRTLEVQITTFRREESYAKGSRHPSVIFGGTLEEDLVRRDFTVNAMAMDSGGRLRDPVGGLADLRAGIIRTPLDPFVTFGEDPLRMLRAFRFACRLGFTLDPPLVDAVRRLHREILGISRERWKAEMDAMLSGTDPGSTARVLRDLMDSGLLTDMIPELAGSSGRGRWDLVLDTVSRLGRPDRLLRWAVLLADLGRPGEGAVVNRTVSAVCDRFRFSRRERGIVVRLVADAMLPTAYSPDWDDAAVMRLAAAAGPDPERLVALAAARISALGGPAAEEAVSRLEHLARRLDVLEQGRGVRVLPKELGERLQARFGPGQGPSVGAVLDALTDAVHRGELPAMAEPGVYLDYMAAHPGLGVSRD